MPSYFIIRDPEISVYCVFHDCLCFWLRFHCKNQHLAELNRNNKKQLVIITEYLIIDILISLDSYNGSRFFGQG